MRTLASILMGGAQQLMAEREDSADGAAKETAVLAALRLIRAAFDRDQAAVAFLRQSEVSGVGRSSPLLVHMLLRLPNSRVRFLAYEGSSACT